MRKLVITLFCIALLLPGRGNTLGLGEIELQSSLNEELKAEIALFSIGQESAETIIVKLASREAFERAGLDRSFILTDLKFKVVNRNGALFIEVTSKKAIREPFLSFLLEIDWPRGNILREFTMLLDPPVFMQQTSDGSTTQVVAPAPEQELPYDTTPAVESTPAAESRFEQSQQTHSQAYVPAPVSIAEPPPVSAPAEQTEIMSQAPVRSRMVSSVPPMPADAYRVQANDTLWRIANDMRPAETSVEQMMMALVRHNPEAFIKENINGVKRGYILRMPDQSDIAAIDQQTALAQVRQQYQEWDDYRQAVIARRSGNEIQRDGSSPETTTMRDGGQLTIASAAGERGSEGATSGSQDPESVISQLRQELAVTAEELESGNMENAELKTRLKALQSQVDSMQKMLNLKDSDLAQLQGSIAPEETAPAEGMPETAEMMPPATDMSEQAAAEVATESAMTESSMPESADSMQPATTDDAAVDMMSGAQPEDQAVFTDEMAANEAQPATPVTPVQPAPIGKQSKNDFIEELLNDPNSLMYLVGGGAGALLLIALIMIVVKRRRNKDDSEQEMAELTGDVDLDDVAAMVSDQEPGYQEDEEEDLGRTLEKFEEEAAAEAEAAADEEAVISLDEPSAEEETPKDDILAEADVYLAYGIYQQAEELLRTAVNENPDRPDYKVKLLETYFASKDKANFVSVASDLQQQINTDSADWQRVVAMGRELEPGNELFSSADVVPDFDVDDLLPKKPETDFDLGDDDSGTMTDFDLGEMEEESNDTEATAILSPEDMDASMGGLDEAGGIDLSEPIDESDDFGLLGTADELDEELGSLDEASLDDEEMDFGDESLDEDFSLDIDMAELGLNDEEEAETDLAADSELEEPEPATADASLEGDDMDMDMDIGTDDLDIESMDLDIGAEEFEGLNLEDEQPAAEETTDDSMDLAGLDLDSDLTAELDAAVAEESTDTDDNMDLGDIDLSTSDDEGGLDLGDIDLSAMTDDSGLDLEADLTAEEPDVSLDTGGAGDGVEIDLAADDIDLSIDDDEVDISSLPADVDEVSTKLDLAQAYIDMGDNDGAASILNEVIEEGNSDHKAAAEDMLKNIA